MSGFRSPTVDYFDEPLGSAVGVVTHAMTEKNGFRRYPPPIRWTWLRSDFTGQISQIKEELLDHDGEWHTTHVNAGPWHRNYGRTPGWGYWGTP